MKKASGSSNSLGAFLTPVPPNNGENAGIYSKGWSSERVPHPSTAGINVRKHVSSVSALTTPFYNGRVLPSKWEDAERWICSPMASYPTGVFSKNSHVNPKSKSGPIATSSQLPPSSSSAIRCYHYSPTATAPALKRVEAPQGSMFSTGVLKADKVFRGTIDAVCNDHGHGHGWMDLVSESSSSISQQDTEEEERGGESPVVARRDMATQMSPEEARPREASSHSYTSPPQPISFNPQNRSLEVREVKIDTRATLIKHSDNPSTAPSSSSSWGISEPAMVYRLQREEAKIAAWENLQKAKAEAAIRKLEVKMEKKKSASIDKILNKLQTAQEKAREMRRSRASSEEDNHISRNSVKRTHLVRRHTFINSFLGCFARRADCTTSSSAI